MRIEKEERKNEKVPVFPPKMSLNKCAELKSLRLLNLISLVPSLQSQHSLVTLFNFLLP